uniref:Uncharacterized protein n=1 Tax=Aegilops tauschii subsp. strangulata TaxID=200361 RepID=A0A453AFB6_AEGTS
MQPDHRRAGSIDAEAYISHASPVTSIHPSISVHKQASGRGSGMAAPRALVLAVLLVIAIANAEATSVVIGLAKCADCTRKNMKA